MKSMAIAGRKVGPDAPCFIIAEIGVNHNGSAAMARQLVEAAKAAGADAVKLQLFNPDLLASPGAPKAAYQESGTAGTADQKEMLRSLTLDTAVVRNLKQQADQLGIALIATPFDLPNLQLIDALDLPAIKIGSGDLDNPILLRAAATTRRPLIVSTGMATLAEVDMAVGWLEQANCTNLALLHCVSVYPAPESLANLRAMDVLAQAYDYPIGFSDHTPGTLVSAAAVARGATMIEKHLTLDCGLPGPDHRASLDPAGFTRLVADIRSVETALGNGRKQPFAAEYETRRVARRSLCLSRDLPDGSVITADALTALRPGDGIPASCFDIVVGRRVTRALAAGHRLAWGDLT
ncbi:N-acetylneuraminate synthase family protein [Ferrovibrio sp.]|uniref:N-acetylneuraminate synthase family protein n=1 Tax=Ferrovibrio sp. TaxID=1917215 RepID=UPI00261A796F|nr:N-acetylneuraminate synthase family protein [Ferrovibrio sp.]